MAEFVLIPALIMGAIIGLLEFFFMSKDVQSSYKFFAHVSFEFVYSLIAVFAVMNVNFVISLLPVLKTIPYLSNPYVFRGAIVLIEIIKVHGKSMTIEKVAQKSMKESWTHCLIIGALTFFTPEIWNLVATNLTLPEWVK